MLVLNKTKIVVVNLREAILISYEFFKEMDQIIQKNWRIWKNKALIEVYNKKYLALIKNQDPNAF